MSTTTIRLPEELKARIAKAAKQAGTTAHNFIVEAIAEKTALAELRAGFDAEAERRYAKLIETGKTIPWNEMRSYLQDSLADGKGQAKRSRPAPHKLAR